MNAVRPVRELKGFRKVELQPGESKEVTFTLCKRSFAYWNTQIHDWYVETGDFAIEVGDSVANLPLRATVKIESTTELPRHFDLDSIVMDVMADPKANAIMGEFLKKAFAIFSIADENQTEAAQEAISDDMGEAMMGYMPIRGTLSFGGGAVPEEMMLDMLKKMNEA